MSSPKQKTLIAALFAFLVFTAIAFRVFEIDNVCSQIVGALFSSAITIAIAFVLIKSQAKADIERDCKSKIFEKKQETYHNFLAEFNRLSAKETYSTDDKKEIIHKMTYHLGLVKMHLDKEIADAVTKKVCETFGIYTSDHTKDYSKIAKNYFDIAELLSKDLYSPQNKTGFNNESGSYNLGVTISGLFDPTLRNAATMKKLHVEWWNMLIAELKDKQENKFDYVFYLEDNNNDETESPEKAVDHFEKAIGNIAFSLKLTENADGNVCFYIASNIYGIDYGFEIEQKPKDEKITEKYRPLLPKGYADEGFGNPGIGAKHIDEKYDIDFYYTNLNYYIFAKAPDVEKKRIVSNFAQEISSDISIFINNINRRRPHYERRK